jgi:hypothetical protein
MYQWRIAPQLRAKGAAWIIGHSADFSRARAQTEAISGNRRCEIAHHGHLTRGSG